MAAACLSLAALRIYYVREMVAALAMFSAVFVSVALTALAIFLLDQFGQHAVAWAGAYAKSFARASYRHAMLAMHRHGN